MRKVITVVLGVMACLLLSNLAVRAWGYQDQDKDRAELAKAVGQAKVSLEKGLSASKSAGTPISAKFEIEEGKLQLSVYTTQTGKFSEIIVDHDKGNIAKVEPITSGEDFTAAKAQGDVMAKVKVSLAAAVVKVLKDNPGSLAVSVVPGLKDGHPVAEIALAQGTQWKTIFEKLD